MKSKIKTNRLAILRIVIIGAVVVFVGILAVLSYRYYLSTQKKTWHKKYYTLYSSDTASISVDVYKVSLDISGGDYTYLLQDCQRIQTDISTMEQIPKYPDAKISRQITQSEKEVSDTANVCVTTTEKNGNANLIGLKTGQDGLGNALGLIGP